MFTPRPAQEKVLNYIDGKMGVSAVPGSGKTWTLSLLAAQIIEKGGLEDDQEVLVVTLVNSAVDNFSSRIGNFIKSMNLLPQMGYRVRTLHGLARDIISERPDLVSLQDKFEIIDDRAGEQILSEIARAWLRSNPYILEPYLKPDLEVNQSDWVIKNHLPDVVRNIATAFIKRAKDYRLTPELIGKRLEQLPAPLPLAEMGYAIYKDYQRALNYQGAVDFDDLIRLAMDALDADPDFLSRLQYQWPFVLEDEAQDSSKLQEDILGKLTGEFGNWVRVGDPNQAIYETFTTADPVYLKNFLAREDVTATTLPNSGRSSQGIIDLANHLINWVRSDHPTAELQNALSPPLIKPTPPGDPQPNPPIEATQIHLVRNKQTPQEEINFVVSSIERYLPDHPDATVAVLVPRNMRGFHLAEALRQRKIIPVEMLRSTENTRKTAGALANILNYLADPKSSSKLSRVYEVWQRDNQDNETKSLIKSVADIIKKCPAVETFLWPASGYDWLDTLILSEADTWIYDHLVDFRRLVQRWQEAAALPIDQLILTLAQDIFYEPAELALAHKLSLLLKRAGDIRQDWRLPELTAELGVIAKNERRFIGFSQDDMGFDPDIYKGKVVITTMHRAKGLEWDRVYLMSVNNYDFPSAQEYDKYISEKWFIRDRLDIQEEMLAQLETLLKDDPYEWYIEGKATQEGRLSYAAERLRLLFVGITRARKELMISWNTGRKYDLQPALPLIALQAFLDTEQLSNNSV